MNVTVRNFKDNSSSEVTGVEVITQVYSSAEIDKDGVQTKPAEVEVTRFNSIEDANKYIKEEYDIYEIKWWKITRYENTLVRRDKKWWISVVPDIIKFWKEVVHYREVGNEEVQKKINGRKRGPRKKVFTIPEPIKGYQMDSDED